MKVPISWLREYVEFDATPEELAEKLVFSGTEVAGLEKVGSDFRDVVVGEVLSLRPHPGADRLQVCRVADGARELNVVCGAFNFAVGDKVPLARAGAVLPNGMEIRKAKIRGEESEGMLCAEDELGLSDDHGGIMILARAQRAGTPLAEVVGGPDVVIDVEITWNRPDCLNIIGLAREVAALCRSRLRRPSVDFAEDVEPVEGFADVAVEDAEGCPRYTARVVRGVRWLPSPPWMRRRLTLCGVRPISNIVDVTNYVMLECGQPLHAFDYNRLADHRIVVRRAQPGEGMATLDGIQRAITPEMLVIADGRRPVALAGIMGGAGSEISGDTRDVLLESAHFNPALIRRTSSRLGLQTESSHRFERGVDVSGVEWASRRAVALLVELAQGTACQGVIDVYPAPVRERRIACRFRRLNGLLGVTVPPETVADIFNRLGMREVSRDAGACTVDVPVLRGDIEVEADLVEEVARLHGLDKIPDTLPAARVVPGADNRRADAVRQCRAVLTGLGLTEVMHYSFLAQSLLDLFSKDDNGRRVTLPNPVSADFAVMRHWLIPQMVETLGRNLAHQTQEAAFFEIGRVFFKEDHGAVSEEDRLCIGLMGPVGRTDTGGKRPVEPEEAFLWAKGLVEALCAAQGTGPLAVAPLQGPAYEDGWAVSLAAGGATVGQMGLVRETIRRNWRLSDPLAVAELRLEPFLAHASRLPALKSVSPYPSITRDVAMIVAEAVTHEHVLAAIWKIAPAELTAVRLFDIFRGEGVGVGKKSLAYSMTYRSMERSLTDAEANGFHDAIKAALRSGVQAEIREN